MPSVYLIHLDRPLKHARHYIGYATFITRRLAHHGTANGSRFMQVVAEAGIGWRLARRWHGASRRFERRLKKRDFGPIANICPLCAGKTIRQMPRLAMLRRAIQRRRRCARTAAGIPATAAA